MKAKVWDRQSAQAIDRSSIEDYGVSGLELMEQAGTRIAIAARHLLTDNPNWTVLVLAGPGNNGGDALVAARLLHEEKFSVQIAGVDHQTDKLTPSTRSQLEKLPKELPVKAFAASTIDSSKYYLVIDGLLGLGVRGSLRPGKMADTLTEVAAIPNKYVLAIDIPSGMDADSWSTTPPLPANTTVTFGAPKPCHVLNPAREACGEIVVEQIAFAKEAVTKVLNQDSTPGLFTAKRFEDNPFERLPMNAHKYQRGHVLVIGGSDGKVGAPIMTGVSALRTGAGWASVAAPKDWLQAYSGLPACLTFEPFFDGKRIASTAFKTFLDQRRVAAVVIGPGTMEQVLNKETLEILGCWQEKTGGGIVLDAGCTQNILDISKPKGLDFRKSILTPHPGEWHKLGGNLPREVGNLEDVRKVAAQQPKLSFTLVHKSATPIVFTKDGGTVSHQSSRWLGKAGSGDIVAGATAAFCTQDIDAAESFLRAIQVVGDAARACTKHRSGHSIIPDDLLTQIGVLSDA